MMLSNRMTEKSRERKPVSQAITSTANVIRLKDPTYLLLEFVPLDGGDTDFDLLDPEDPPTPAITIFGPKYFTGLLFHTFHFTVLYATCKLYK